MADRELTLPSYGARFRDMARRSGLADFWQWWRGELAALVPSAPRTAIARRRMRPVLVFAGDRATLWRASVEGGAPVMEPVREIALANDAEGSAAIASLAAAGRTPRVVVSLNPLDCLRKRITLPAALEENLVQALAYDLDRHTPFKADELYFDAAVVERNPSRGTIVADLAAARRSSVDPALRHIAAWGAEVAAIVPDPPASASQSRLNLVPREMRKSRPLSRRFELWIPLLVVGALALAAAAIPVWQKRLYVQQLHAQADEARTRAAVSETLRAELNRRVADYNFALERKYAFPGALAALDTVSRILPDDTWLTQFEIKTIPKGKDTQRDVMLRGETANAGRLVQLFEDSQMFVQAAQRGPTTKIQPGPGEIFDLGMQLKQMPPPPPVATTVALPAAAVPAAPAATATATPAAAPAAAPAASPAPSAAAPAKAPGAPATPAAATPNAVAPAAPAAPAPATPPVAAPATAAAPAPPPAKTGAKP
jgi:general secretion pathway protein L